MNESKFHYVDDPTVAAHGDGAHVLWVDNRRQDVFFQRLGPDGSVAANDPVNVSGSPEIFSWLPRMAVGAQDEIFVLWQEIVFSGGSHGGEAFFARSLDGKQFEEPLNLSNTQAGCGKGRLTQDRWHNGSLDLALGKNQEIYTAWTEYEGPLRFSRSLDRGATFSDPLLLAGSEQQPARGPALAVGSDGTVYLAWAVGENPRGNIQLSWSKDGGKTFAEPQTAVSTKGYSDAPKLVVDDRGTVHLVFAERPDGMFAQAQVAYAQRTKEGDSFTNRRIVSGSSELPSAGADFPYAGVDAKGTLYLAWEHHPDGAPEAHGLAMTHSADQGETFSAPFVVPGSTDAPGVNGSRQGKLMRKLDVTERGRVLVVNSSFDSGNQSVVRLFRAQ